jgi:hypothetical protein
VSFLIKVVNYFLRFVFFLIVNRQAQLALFRTQYHRLSFHAAHHIKRQLRLAPKRHLKKVLLNALLDGLAQIGLYLEVPVCRAQAAQPLVRTLVVVILHPLTDTLLSVLETCELRSAQELHEDRLPEPLDLAKRHRVVRPRFDVVDSVFLQLRFKPAGPPPRRVLTPVVRQHLAGRVVLRYRSPVHLDHVLTRLAPEQVKASNIPRIIVDISDQKGVPAAKTEREDVRLPKLVRGGPLEKPGAGDVPLALLLCRRRHEGRAPEGLAYRLRARPEKKHPLQKLGYAFDAELRVGLLDLDDLLPDRQRQLRFAVPAVPVRKTCFSLALVQPGPALYRSRTDPALLTNQRYRYALLHQQLYSLELEISPVPLAPVRILPFSNAFLYTL